VADNVAFGPRSAGVRRDEARATALRWLAAVGLEDRAASRATELSGGQAQRVAVARALAADPEVLLLDEPLAALDVDVAPALRHRLREVLAEQTTVLATHDVLDALLLADRVAVVEDGRVVEEGPTAEVLARPRSAFAARIAGLNLVRGTWRGDRLVTEEGTEVHGLTHGDVPSYSSTATAVFRPSAVAVYLHDVAGSPRNHFPLVVRALEPRGDLVRVTGESGGLTLAADVTPQSVAELGLVPGLRVSLTVKATEVSVYGV
jgi:molybdate transport system ATP-binding protein